LFLRIVLKTNISIEGILMSALQPDIIARLRKEILPLQGLSSSYCDNMLDAGLGNMNEAFPNRCFPFGAVHEFITETTESVSASAGFISGILSGLMKTGGICIWISRNRSIFPPAISSFGINPDQILFVDLQKEKDLLWAMEEALKCKGLQAVVGEISDLSFTVSRRFQLAVEQSHVTGFIIRDNPGNLFPNACVSRWKIKQLPSYSIDYLPGVGFPHWHIELQKIRNGRPGFWDLAWIADGFHQIEKIIPSILSQPERKVV
jgi:protein ImuA